VAQAFFGVSTISFGGYPDILYFISVPIGLVAFKRRILDTEKARH
jgi:hypothetical protein